MRKHRITHKLDGIAALLLFAVFAVCILAVLLTGAGAYRRLTERDTEAYARRTCVQYLSQRVRQADWEGGVRVEDFGGVPALVLGADQEYVTQVYCHDGWLMELYSAPDSGLTPDAGEKIMEAQGLELALNDGVLGMGVTVEDETQWLFMELRSGKGWQP